MADAQPSTPAPIQILQPIKSGAQPIDIGTDEKSGFAELDGALNAIPGNHSHAILLDATATGAALSDTGVKAMYVQRLPAGWGLAMEGDYYGTGHVAGQIVIGKSW